MIVREKSDCCGAMVTWSTAFGDDDPVLCCKVCWNEQSVLVEVGA